VTNFVDIKIIGNRIDPGRKSTQALLDAGDVPGMQALKSADGLDLKKRLECACLRGALACARRATMPHRQQHQSRDDSTHG
jgi:hypothetical protein